MVVVPTGGSGRCRGCARRRRGSANERSGSRSGAPRRRCPCGYLTAVQGRPRLALAKQCQPANAGCLSTRAETPTRHPAVTRFGWSSPSAATLSECSGYIHTSLLLRAPALARRTSPRPGQAGASHATADRPDCGRGAEFVSDPARPRQPPLPAVLLLPFRHIRRSLVSERVSRKWHRCWRCGTVPAVPPHGASTSNRQQA